MSATAHKLKPKSGPNSGDHVPRRADGSEICQVDEANDLFRYYVSAEGPTFDFNKRDQLPHNAFKSAIFNAIANEIGDNWKYARNQASVIELAHHYGSLLAYLEENYEPEVLEDSRVKMFFEILASRNEDLRQRLLRSLETGDIMYEDVGLLFKIGQHVVFSDGADLIGGVCRGTKHVSSWTGAYWEIDVEIIHNLAGPAAIGKVKGRIRAFRGREKITELDVREPTAEDVAALAARGEKWRRFVCGGATYAGYEGHLARANWWASQTFRADGRIMADTPTMMRVDNEQYSAEKRGVLGYESERNEQHVAALVVSDEDLWRCAPYFLGFSFRAKTWGRMRVDGLKPISWREDAFDKLVLAQDTKEMVRALVEYSGSAFTDIIEDKGGGCIFLLHGPPGQGKTLTAEAVAEILHRPLYTVTIGELGTTPDELEERLRQILDVALVWNAVILLDEADIFLESRTKDDLVRNAMVGVFLRLLEYHQGVLFLTTNRVQDIDEAFYSRISLAIHYRDGDHGMTPEQKRFHIWTNLLSAAAIEVSEKDRRHVALHDINGRQIKNAIRMSATLSHARKTPIDADILEEIVKKSLEFKKELEKARRDRGPAE